MKIKRYDSQPLGLAVGAVAPAVGLVVYGVLWAIYFNKTFTHFFQEVFIGIPAFRSSIITLALVFNLVPFFIFLGGQRNKSARGVLLAVFLYIPLVVYFRFFD